MTVIKLPRFSLVGAGPGDPELLTLKGLKALQKADVILYDALANPELLEHAPEALHIFVGKRRGFKRYTQPEINALIVHHARKSGHVVRLKGGDSFMFGRGGEERDYAIAHGIPVEIVPGISSAYGVPASEGISLTTRGISESVWVITGTTSAREMSRDVALAAQSSATVVILMGMHKLAQIVAAFQRAGKGGLPCAIIQNGTRANSASVLGSIDTILSLKEEHQLGAPAIIVAGEVARQIDDQSVVVESLLQRAGVTC